MGQPLSITVNAGDFPGQIISGFLLNAFYSAQILQVSQGKTLDDQERAILLQVVIGEFHKMCALIKKAGEDLPSHNSQAPPAKQHS